MINAVKENSNISVLVILYLIFIDAKRKQFYNRLMPSQKMISFRCHRSLYRRLNTFAQLRHIDRTSALKLALHYYLNHRHM